MGNNLSVHYSSKSDNWNTPKFIVPLLLEVMGEIDLDPCSNDANNPNIPARVCYDGRNVDGLSADWLPRTYMNSPYGRVIGKWTRKALKEVALCHTSELIMLIPARTDTKWFRELWIGTVCFVRGRLKFVNESLPSYKEDGNFKVSPAPFPSAFVYFGNNTDRFAQVFGAIGDIVRRYKY
jgi:hypothetical protein